MNKKAKIIIIILLSIIIIGLSYYIVYKKKTDVVIETPVIRKSIKLDDEKEYIYGITNDELSVYENISFPYININSSDARNANSDINEIYKIVMNNLSDDLRNKKTDLSPYLFNFTKGRGCLHNIINDFFHLPRMHP